MKKSSRKKSSIKKSKKFLSGFKLFAFLGFLTFAIGATIYLAQQQNPRSQAAETIIGGIVIPSTTSLIMLAGNQDELTKYQGLAGLGKEISYRTVNYDPSSEITLFENNSWKYFVTVASSDFLGYQNSGSLYNYSLSQLQSIAGNPGFKGFYFHEILTYRAAVNNYDWDIARDTLDWGYIQQIFSIAKSSGKKVIWAEPTFAWKTLYEDRHGSIDPLLRSWAGELVPMYSTNFSQAEIDSAKEYAIKVAQKYVLPLGQSHQAWYWQTPTGGTAASRSGSFNLAIDGWNANARYFQFEGNVNDFLWDSPYMLGVRDFANFVSNQYITPTPTTVINTPTPTLAPSSTKPTKKPPRR